MNASTVIKILFTGLFFTILSFLLGAYALSHAIELMLSMGFFALLLTLFYLRERAWALLFIFPLALNRIPVLVLEKMAPGYILALLVLVFFVVLSFMGKLRLRWRSLWYMDIVVLMVLLAYLVQYLRYPIGVTGLGELNGMVGGRDYILVLLATLFYVSLSIAPVEGRQLKAVLRITVASLIIISLLTAVVELLGLGSGDYVQEAVEHRFGGFALLGNTLFVLILSFNQPWTLMRSPIKAACTLLAVAMVLLSGFREQLGRIGVIAALAAFIHRQALLFLLLAVVGYGGVLALSQAGLVGKMPFGVQRALSILPGVKVGAQARIDATYSLDWREEMWEWAMDPQEGYIKDYVWGDGYGQSTELMRLNIIQHGRKEGDVTHRDVYADTGVWHNGPIHMIHRMGYMGLGLMSVLMLSFSLLAIRVCVMYRGHELFPYVIFLLVGLPADCILFYVSAGTTLKIMGMYYTFAMAKFFYLYRREEGGTSRNSMPFK